MNRRLVIKTICICSGIFILLSSIIIFYLSHNYKLDIEQRLQVVVASTDIEAGTVINESNVSYRTIRISSYNDHMIKDIKLAIGQKATSRISGSDYVRNYLLVSRDKWYEHDAREVVLPMDFEARLANLIKKGSTIDIMVDLNNVKAKPKVILSKVRIEEIIDDNGIIAGDTIGNRKAFAKFIMNKEDRDKIYIAQKLGKLKFELYCDSSQESALEEFEIPAEYLKQ